MSFSPHLQIKFLGAAQTVTGSCTQVTYKGKHYLVDSGLFQGPQNIREKNWEAFEGANQIEALILTHAHIDHSGYIPKLVKEGFSGPIYCSVGTAELCKIMLMDSAHLQEEDAAFLNRRGKSRHHPALPLYTMDDAEKALKQFQAQPKDQWIVLQEGLSFRLIRSGHILGSTFVQFSFETGNGVKLLTFSGDLGNGRQRVIKGPMNIKESDYLVMESTYGDRCVPKGDVESELAQIINRTFERGGVVVIPAFAVGRTQELLFILRSLEDQKRIPEVPVYVDSPMANNSTAIYINSPEELALKLVDGELEQPICTRNFTAVRSADDSMLLCMQDGPFIVISAAGMLTGGRVLHHLKSRLPDPRNTIVFVGYQVEETKGRLLQNGLQKIRIHKEVIDVEAEVVSITTLSAHADSQEIIDWISRFSRPPGQVFLNHGEPAAINALCYRLRTELELDVKVPSENEVYELT